MSILIKSAKILDPTSPYHGKVKNILIANGKIKEISDATPKAKKVIDAKGCYLTQGWMDFRAFLGEPGFEYVETLASGTQAAAAGGFTDLACMPNTQPVIQNKDLVLSLQRENGQRVTSVHPIGALSKDIQGKELTEVIDLNQVGVSLFSDGYEPIKNPALLVKALQYCQVVDGLVIDFPQDEKLAEGGQVHEGIQSTALGLKSIASFHETIRINRDLEILRYTGGRLHFSNVSTKEGVKLIKKAKKEGLQITCDVAIANLAFNEKLVENFDTNGKVNPPLRSEKDRKALWDGVKEGVIDVIASNHIPLDEESKKLEFDLATFGMSCLEVFLPMLLQDTKLDKWEEVLPAITTNPRDLAKLDHTSIQEGTEVKLTLFNPKKEWVYDAKTAHSLSHNSPLYGKKVKGKVIATINGVNEYVANV